MGLAVGAVAIFPCAAGLCSYSSANLPDIGVVTPFQGKGRLSYVILVDKRVVVLMCEQPHESIATVVLIIILAVPDTGHWAHWAQLGLERRRKTEWMPSASVKNMP